MKKALKSSEKEKLDGRSKHLEIGGGKLSGSEIKKQGGKRITTLRSEERVLTGV